jgi:hypothetical protein
MSFIVQRRRQDTREECSSECSLTGCSASDRIFQLCSKNFCKTIHQFSHLLQIISVGALFYNAEVMIWHLVRKFMFFLNFSFCYLLFLIAVLLNRLSTKYFSFISFIHLFTFHKSYRCGTCVTFSDLP